MIEIKTIEQATLIALEFLARAGHYYRKAQKTEPVAGGWRVEAAVGIMGDKIAKVEIASNGEITSFEVVPRQ